MQPQWLLKMFFSSGVRAKTWHKMATLLKHNVPERYCLTILKDRYAARKHPLEAVFSAIIAEIDKGQPLDVALYPWVPHEEVMLLRGGKRSNNMVGALEDCIAVIKAKAEITGALVSALVYPVVLIAMLLLVLVVVALYVVPELALLSNPELLDGSAAALYRVSRFIASPAGVIAILLFIGSIVAAIVSMPWWTGPLRVKADSYPPFSFYRLITGSVWLFTVATLLRANTQLDAILTDMPQSGVLRPWLRERVQLIKARYATEMNLGELLVNLKMNFPDKELAEDLAIYAGFQDFYQNLYTISFEWLKDGITRIRAQANVLNICVMCVIFGILCSLGLAIGSLNQQLNSTMGGM